MGFSGYETFGTNDTATHNGCSEYEIYLLQMIRPHRGVVLGMKSIWI